MAINLSQSAKQFLSQQRAVYDFFYELDESDAKKDEDYYLGSLFQRTPVVEKLLQRISDVAPTCSEQKVSYKLTYHQSDPNF